MSIGKIGLSGIFANGKMKLASKSHLAKTLFANSKFTETIETDLSAKSAKPFLDLFGKYSKELNLNPEHVYEYTNSYTSAQLVDKTTNKNVILALKEIKRPIGKFIQGFFGAWKNY